MDQPNWTLIELPWSSYTRHSITPHVTSRSLHDPHGHPWPSWTLNDTLELNIIFMILIDFLTSKPSMTPTGHSLNLFKAHGPSMILLNPPWPSWTIHYHHGPYLTLLDRPWSSWKHQDPYGPPHHESNWTFIEPPWSSMTFKDLPWPS